MKIIRNILFGDRHPLLRSALSVLIHVLCLMTLDVSFRVIYEKNNTSPLPDLVPFYTSLFWCIILAGFALILPRILRRIYVIVTTLFFGVLVIVHACLDSFFGQYMSFSSVMFADDGAAFFDLSYFKIPKKLIALILLSIVLSVIAALILAKSKKYLISALAAILLVAVGITGIALYSNSYFKGESGGITWESTKSPADHYDDFSDYHLCMHMCGLYQYTFRDLYVSTGAVDTVEKLINKGRIDELDEYYSSKPIDPDNEMTGIFKDKNLLLVQLESIDTWMVNEVSMPSLYSVTNKGINFTSFYAPKYLWASTFNTENVVNTGMISPMNSSKTGYFTKTDYPYSMPNMFKAEGYTVNSFHRSGRGIYNRGDVHENWGYTKYYSGAEMKLSDLDMDSALIEAYDMYAPAERFMSFIITYTGHGPYNAEHEAVKKYEDIIRPKLPEDAEDEYVWALCYAYETDVFIGSLIEKLEAEDRLKDTVLIFYTDHYDHYVTDNAILTKYKGTSDTNLMCNVPFVIYSEELEPMTVDKVTATYDILPTVVNLFGMDNDGRYYIGNDAFSDNGGYVIFADRSWYDGSVYSKSDTMSFDLIEQRSTEIDERLNACWDSIKFDYFKDK
ncbi:MAG: sulfatase-like hydrolase/transferase [Clostridia bacterium]|nr:sulfatase-like hydrolase/transferase [Clostridia bacterium]